MWQICLFYVERIMCFFVCVCAISGTQGGPYETIIISEQRKWTSLSSLRLLLCIPVAVCYIWQKNYNNLAFITQTKSRIRKKKGLVWPVDHGDQQLIAVSPRQLYMFRFNFTTPRETRRSEHQETFVHSELMKSNSTANKVDTQMEVPVMDAN